MSRVAIRYSKALFQLAAEKNLIDEVQSDLGMIKDTCIANPEFQSVLINPLIEENAKAKILADMFADRVNDLTLRFLQLLSRKRRSGFLLEMIDRFMNSVLDYRGILAGTIVSSSELEPGQIEEIKKKITTLTGKQVLLSEQIDRSMLGGFIVKIKDTVIDLSIKTQVEKLRARLMHG